MSAPADLFTKDDQLWFEIHHSVLKEESGKKDAQEKNAPLILSILKQFFDDLADGKYVHLQGWIQDCITSMETEGNSPGESSHEARFMAVRNWLYALRKGVCAPVDPQPDNADSREGSTVLTSGSEEASFRPPPGSSARQRRGAFVIRPERLAIADTVVATEQPADSVSTNSFVIDWLSKVERHLGGTELTEASVPDKWPGHREVNLTQNV